MREPINEARVGGIPNHNGQSEVGRGRQQPINEARVGRISHYNGRPAQRNRGRTPRIRGNEAIFPGTAAMCFISWHDGKGKLYMLRYLACYGELYVLRWMRRVLVKACV